MRLRRSPSMLFAGDAGMTISRAPARVYPLYCLPGGPMESDSLRDLYIDELRDVLNAEKQLTQALPKMAEASSNEELRSAFEDHLAVTEEHVRRLETIFDELGMAARGKKCVGMEGLIAEGKEKMEEDLEPQVLDAALISAAQRVEHYEIAAYGTLRSYAQQLGYDSQANLLQRTLDEEGEADKLLTQIAESAVNLEAQMGDD
jgi:ferritin-like metal-binding protein YciE